MNRGELFKGVMQWEVLTKDLSLEGKIPTFYYDNTAMMAIYTASTGKVRQLLPLPAMRPVEAWPGRALVAFTAFEYRKTDIDPYNELSISFLITFDKQSVPGVTAMSMLAKRYYMTYVWQLPVTTERARKGGVDLFGYPKFIADINFTGTDDALTCTLSEGGENILVISGQKLKTAPDKFNRIKTYSVKEGVPLVANVYIHPIEIGKSMSPKAATLSLGDHPIAQKLKEINLSSNPLFFMYMPVMEAALFFPHNLMDD